MRGIPDDTWKYVQTIWMKIKRINPHLWLIIILMFALFLRLYFFVGLNWSDDIRYAYDAHRVLNGEYYLGNFLPSLRIGMIYPITFFYSLFGINDISLILYPLLTSLGCIVVIFYLGKMLFDEKVGLLSSFFLAFFPLDVIYATWSLPDIPVAFFCALSVLLFLKAKNIDTKIFNRFDKSKLLFFISGTLIGFSYLNKVSGAIILFFLFLYIIYILVKKRDKKFDYLFLFFGFFFILIIEGLFYYFNNGDFFTRYNVVSSYYTPNWSGVNSDLGFYPMLMFNINRNLSFNFDNPYFVEYGLFYYFIFLSFIYITFKKNKNAILCLFWFVILFLYLGFGSMSMTSYLPIHKLPRHLAVLTIPGLLCLSYFLIEFLKTKKTIHIKKILVVSTICFLIVTSCYYTSHTSEYLDASTHDMKEIYEFTKKYDEKDTYCNNSIILYHLLFYYKFEKHSPIKLLITERYEELEDCFVIINSSGGSIEPPFIKNEKPFFPQQSSSSWVLVKVISGPKIGFYGMFDPEIYYIPKTNGTY
jgi:4-amino-4-deoxy-L-arabinose transferase-like glycosyltransferase